MTEPASMADPNTSLSPADLHMQHLKGLQTSFVPLPLTNEQEYEKDERKMGRCFWEDVLIQYREARASTKI
jgi:hypothetical protein